MAAELHRLVTSFCTRLERGHLRLGEHVLVEESLAVERDGVFLRGHFLF
jgi:hypothetical protein